MSKNRGILRRSAPKLNLNWKLPRPPGEKSAHIGPGVARSQKNLHVLLYHHSRAERIVDHPARICARASYVIIRRRSTILLYYRKNRSLVASSPPKKGNGSCRGNLAGIAQGASTWLPRVSSRLPGKILDARNRVTYISSPRAIIPDQPRNTISFRHSSHLSRDSTIHTVVSRDLSDS